MQAPEAQRSALPLPASAAVVDEPFDESKLSIGTAAWRPFFFTATLPCQGGPERINGFGSCSETLLAFVSLEILRCREGGGKKILLGRDTFPRPLR